jgi:2-keto-4-pentenoate hydratase/2-oxohepta-3-ene-1,7-dioic acid hydratase in catechol pathway
VVIGSICKNVEAEDVGMYIWGYTIANDVTARDLQGTDVQWARSKAFDTFCPLGPWIETEFENDGQLIASRINGETAQSATLNDMIFGVAEIVSHVSKNMTLLPGDIILTGTPAGVAQIKHGDIVECEVEGIGTLISHVL